MASRPIDACSGVAAPFSPLPVDAAKNGRSGATHPESRSGRVLNSALLVGLNGLLVWIAISIGSGPTTVSGRLVLCLASGAAAAVARMVFGLPSLLITCSTVIAACHPLVLSVVVPSPAPHSTLAALSFVDRQHVVSSRLGALAAEFFVPAPQYLGWTLIALSLFAVWPGCRARQSRPAAVTLLVALSALWALRPGPSQHAALRRLLSAVTVEHFVPNDTLNALGLVCVPLLMLPLLVGLAVAGTISGGRRAGFPMIAIATSAALAWWALGSGGILGQPHLDGPAVALASFAFCCVAAQGFKRALELGATRWRRWLIALLIGLATVADVEPPWAKAAWSCTRERAAGGRERAADLMLNRREGGARRVSSHPTSLTRTPAASHPSPPFYSMQSAGDKHHPNDPRPQTASKRNASDTVRA